MANREEVKKVLAMFVTLPNSPLSTDPNTNAGVISAFHASLSDVPVEWLTAAAYKYLSEDNRFFPSNPGTLREIAFDLEMLAQGVPTAAQAWAMVLKGPGWVPAQICEVGAEIRRLIDPAGLDYFHRLDDLAKHEKKCEICQPVTRQGTYGNPVVDAVVRMMGGREVILTESITADRARFFDSYRELVDVERRRLQLPPAVSSLISSPNRPVLGKITGLAAQLTAGGGDQR